VKRDPGGGGAVKTGLVERTRRFRHPDAGRREDVAMRGRPDRPQSFWYSIDVEDLIEADQPLRAIKRMVDEALKDMSRAFTAAYSTTGRPGVAPERLLRSLLPQSPYSIRSERELCRRLKTDLLFRWFLDMTPDEEVFVPTVFTHNRERLAEHGLTRRFFEGVVRQAIDAGLASDEHFTVDGSLIQSHASLKSLKRIAREDGHGNDDPTPPTGGGPGRRSRNESVDFRGERRTNATHRSSTDPEARLYRKGDTGAYLCHSMHALTENRHGLVLAVTLDEANGYAERTSALRLVKQVRKRHDIEVGTLAADKGYDAEAFLSELRGLDVRPHVALRAEVESGEARAIVRRMSRHRPYALSQRRRKLVEALFGWLKTVSGLRRTRHVGRWKIEQQLEVGAAAFSLVKMVKLRAA
jgi:transposase